MDPAKKTLGSDGFVQDAEASIVSEAMVGEELQKTNGTRKKKSAHGMVHGSRGIRTPAEHKAGTRAIHAYGGAQCACRPFLTCIGS